jgi:thiol-disulfide isomerase/thioredoxin
MKTTTLVTLFLASLLQQSLFSQTANELIHQVLKAQQNLKTVTYTFVRQDTLVTGHTRFVNGQTKARIAAGDSLFGFMFWTKRDDDNKEFIYDGNTGMEIIHDKKMYKVISDKERLLLLPHQMGYLIFKELVKLDTAGAAGFDVARDKDYYYLTVHLPDITKYDVTNRYRRYTIDKHLMLPVRMRNYQETLGKVQSLNYEVKDIRVNNNEHAYDFAGQRYPASYQQEIHRPAKPKTSALLHQPAPPFDLVSYNGEKRTLEQISGKPLLLDFGELWCGPCLASMEKVQALYDKYKSKGLLVYTVSFDKSQLDNFKKMLDKLNVNVPLYLGNIDMRKTYEADGIPKYVLIDKNGQVSFTTTGFSDVLEKEVIKVLQE